jgi:hypothetical protein
MIPTDLGNKKAVGFHGCAGRFREAAGLRPCAFSADSAAAGAKTQSVGVLFAQLPGKGMKEEWLESKKDDPNAEIKGDYIFLYETTKTGKRKTTFEKLGTLSDTCGYFYDYNF